LENYVLDGARETLVLLGIVVLEADLEVHSLHEVPLFGLERVLQAFSVPYPKV